MSNVKNVTVEQVSAKDVKTRYGMKQTHSFKADGMWYNTSFKKAPVVVGDVVSFDFTENSYGKDVSLPTLVKTGTLITSSKEIIGASPASPTIPRPAPTSNSGKGTFPIPALDGQRSIVRQNALTNARELVSLTQENYSYDAWTKRTDAHTALAREIIRVARILEAYTTGDMDMEEVKAEMAADAIEAKLGKKSA